MKNEQNKVFYVVLNQKAFFLLGFIPSHVSGVKSNSKSDNAARLLNSRPITKSRLKFNNLEAKALVCHMAPVLTCVMNNGGVISSDLKSFQYLISLIKFSGVKIH